jgi:hypothetical protein
MVHCPSCQEKKEHEFLKEIGEYNEIYAVKCKTCATEHEVPRKMWLFHEHVDEISSSKKAYLTKWPRWNYQFGCEVKSKDHESAIAKKRGYVKEE